MTSLRANWLFLAALASACGSVQDIYLGAVPEPSGGRAGGTGNEVSMGGASAGQSWICAAAPCARYGGSHAFVAQGAPADAPGRFANAPLGPESEGTKRPRWVYPNHETHLPINLGPLHHEWSAGEGNMLFQIRYVGPQTEVVVYTAGTSFQPSEELWDWIAESNLGGSVEVQLSALTSSGQRFDAAPLTLGMAVPLPEGDVYYWSTSARGLLRARITSHQPERVTLSATSLEPAPTQPAPVEPLPSNTCHGCHSLSRDGAWLALDAGEGQLHVVSTLELQPHPLESAGGAGAGPDAGKGDKTGPTTPAVWSTFSPDSKRVLAASGSKLRLFEFSGGALAGEPSAVVTLPEKSSPSHPDWSPRGDLIALTLAEKGQGRAIERGSIALIRYASESPTAQLSPPEILVESQDMQDNNLFPAFSPDGQFLAYVNLRGKSEDSQSAAIRLLRLSDGKTFELTRLNRRVVDAEASMEFGNSMPTWTQSADSLTTWLSFSSLRPYASLRPHDTKREQLWLAAIDLRAAADAALEGPADPSWAAFWAPFQLLAHANHRAQFGPARTEPACSCRELCGDGRDNDCDGAIDEPPCGGACELLERCDDQLDNDCDCVVDDCSAEICGDGVDNDGDGYSDDSDASCSDP